MLSAAIYETESVEVEDGQFGFRNQKGSLYVYDWLHDEPDGLRRLSGISAMGLVCKISGI